MFKQQLFEKNKNEQIHKGKYSYYFCSDMHNALQSVSCASLVQLQCIPRQKLKRQLEAPFEGVQLVNVTAEASVSVVIAGAKLL